MAHTTEGMLDRCKDIYLYLLKKKEGESSEELSSIYSVSVKTIQRDMLILSYNGLVIYKDRKWHAVPKRIKGIA